ncbi:MAG: autotransporter assembly complex protein TamA [Paracoccaceae bacterium]
MPALVLISALGIVALPAKALETVTLALGDMPAELADSLRPASALQTAQTEGVTDGLDILTAAQGDYGRLLTALYAEGYYSGVITIRLDGREAAEIAALDAPARFRRAEITVRPGPRFTLADPRIAPLAPGSHPSAEFATGAPALAGSVQSAVTSAREDWRNAGHAKVSVASQDITADHRRALLYPRIKLAPGPKVTFGQLRISGKSAVRAERIAEIAGFPTGRQFEPRRLDRVAERLRRTGAFRSVTLTEEDALRAGNLLDVTAALTDMPPRRFGFGAEIASTEGVELSGYWMHRNLLGGAENLRFDGRISEIGSDGGADYSLSAQLTRPGTVTPDTTAYLRAEIAHTNDPDLQSDSGNIAIGLRQDFTVRLSAEIALSYSYSDITDALGSQRYRNLSVPLLLEYDRRDDPLNATGGYYAKAEVTPFLGFGTTSSGTRLTFDARAYRSAGDDTLVTFAGRFRLGSIQGAGVVGTPRDYLFYSGGGGTVRGQPFEALGVYVLRADQRSGGTQFIGLSGEARVKLRGKLSGMAFYDAGYVSATGLFDDSGNWHSGAGIGIRYDTGIGPIRFDIAAPVSGDTGDGVQFYVGIGQAF